MFKNHFLRQQESDIIKYIYICDLDGTLLNNRARLSKEVASGLNNLLDKDLLFTYITGRDLMSSREIMEKIDIKMPVAVCNGGLIIDFKSGELIKGCFIERNIVEGLLKLSEKMQMYPNLTLYMHSMVRTCYFALDRRINREYYRNKIDRNTFTQFEAKRIEDVVTDKVISIAFVDLKEKIEDSKPYVIKEFGNLASISFFEDPFDKSILIIDITSQLCSKGTAAQYIADMYGLPKDSIVAFGNDLSDVELLKMAGVGIAVGDSPAELKKIATTELTYNEGYSVLKYIAEHFNTTKGAG